MLNLHLVIALVLVTLLDGAGVVRAAEAPKVVTTLRPIHSLVTNVMEGVAEPYLLIQGGTTPHRYSLKPSQIRALHGSDLVFWVGAEMETFLHKQLKSLPNAVEVLALAELSNLIRHANRSGGVWTGHEDHHAETESDTHTDMHLWLDPRNARRWVVAIREALLRKDSANAAIYQANAKRLLSRIDNIDQHLIQKLQGVSGVPYVVFHDAYQYFERRYDLNPVGAITVSSGRAPGARRLHQVREQIRERGAICLFTEPQFEPRLATTIVKDLSIYTGVLDPLGTELVPGSQLYFDLLQNLGDTIHTCLSANRN